jgi:hypothetical protein
MYQHRTTTRNAKEIQKKAHSHTVDAISGCPDRWTVTSGTSGKTYMVTYNYPFRTFTCNCDWGKHKGGHCSHVEAVIEMLAFAHQDRTASMWADEDAAKRQHRIRVLAAKAEDGTEVWVTLR